MCNKRAGGVIREGTERFYELMNVASFIANFSNVTKVNLLFIL